MAHQGNRRFFTVLDLAHRDMPVQLVCRGCDNRRPCSPAEMARVFGLGVRLMDAERRLRCCNCGVRGGRIAIGAGRRA